MNQPDALIGQLVLGRYRVVQPLAKGGMGVIYLARSEGAAGFVRPVVVKRILREFVGDESLVNMFAREARIMAQLHHPGIVSVVDFAEEDSAYVMVLEYVHGFTLGRWLRFVKALNRNFPVELAVHVVIQVLDALDYAHTLRDSKGVSLNIIHRDVTPSNVLLDVEGHVKLADFGIARMTSDKTEPGTDDRTIKGKFAYLAPEQFLGAEPGPLTDVYACAVVLRELLAGTNFFALREMQATVARVMNEMPPPIETVRSDVTPALSAVLTKGLSKLPSGRYRTAADFAADLRGARQLSTDAAAAEMARAVDADFNDPQMATLMRVTPLKDLDASWREYKAPVDATGSSRTRGTPAGASAAAVEPMVAAKAGGLSGVGKVWLASAVSVSLMLSLGAGFVVLFRQKQPTMPAPVLVVEGQSDDNGSEGSASATGAAVTPVAEANDGATDAPAVKVERNRSKPTRPARPADPFSRFVAQQQSRFTGCFNKHGGGADATGRFEVRFSVDQDGKVSDAQIVDAKFQGTPWATAWSM